MNIKDPNDVSFTITKTDRHCDKYEGIDFYLTWESKKQNCIIKMPIQIKPNVLSQKKHVEKFPNIPSVRTDRGDRKLSINIIKMMEAYAVGKILHK